MNYNNLAIRTCCTLQINAQNWSFWLYLFTWL